MSNNNKKQAKHKWHVSLTAKARSGGLNAEGIHEAPSVRTEHWRCAKSPDNDVVVRQSSERFAGS